MQDILTGSTSSGLDEPLPSLPLSSLTPNAPEVAHVFALPLSELTSRARLRARSFRNDTTRPYWCIDVSDLCLGSTTAEECQTSMLRHTIDDDMGADNGAKSRNSAYISNSACGTPKICATDKHAATEPEWEFVRAGITATGDGNCLEIWGLTAWYLSLFMRTLKIIA